MGRVAEKVKEAGKNISRDVRMGFDPNSRDADYYARTAKTIARTQGSDAAQRYADQMNKKGGTAGQGIASLKGGALAQAAAQRDKEIARRAADSDDRDTRRAAAAAAAESTTPKADDMADQYAENMRRYQEFMQSQQPQQPAITPEMRQAALQTFESQQGAGQVPYYMAAARNQYNPNMSPAFQYAAQNYDVLGGSQRLGPRPMEMMSVAERSQINDMAQAMADQQAQQQAQQMDYQRGMDMVMGGGGKGGPRTGPQLPPGMVGLPRTPDYGGGMPRSSLPFASILASRFGGFGG